MWKFHSIFFFLQATALMLQQEADKWEPNNNLYVEAIKHVAENMKVLSGFGKDPQPIMVGVSIDHLAF